PRPPPGGAPPTTVLGRPSSPYLWRSAAAPAGQPAGFDAIGGPGAAGTESPARAEMPLARHMVDLDANAVGILEEQRIVSGGELCAVLRWVHDARLQLVDDEAMDRIDVLAAARAKAHGGEAGAIQIEA